MRLVLLTMGLSAVDRNEPLHKPDFWEYSNHEQPPVKQTEWRPDLLKPQVQFRGGAAVGPSGQAALQGELLGHLQPFIPTSAMAKGRHKGRQAKSILPDQRVAEAQDGADQPELRREAGKEGEVTQADFDASYQEHKGWGRQGQTCCEFFSWVGDTQGS